MDLVVFESAIRTLTKETGEQIVDMADLGWAAPWYVLYLAACGVVVLGDSRHEPSCKRNTFVCAPLSNISGHAKGRRLRQSATSCRLERTEPCRVESATGILYRPVPVCPAWLRWERRGKSMVQRNEERGDGSELNF